MPTSLVQMVSIFSLSFTNFKLHWLAGAGRSNFFFVSDFEVLMGMGSPLAMFWLEDANLVFFFLLSLSSSPFFFSLYFLPGAASWLWDRADIMA
jgi:hypothetical protein